MYTPSTASLSDMAQGGARPEQVPAPRLGGRDSAHYAQVIRQPLRPGPDQGGSENVCFNTFVRHGSAVPAAGDGLVPRCNEIFAGLAVVLEWFSFGRWPGRHRFLSLDVRGAVNATE